MASRLEEGVQYPYCAKNYIIFVISKFQKIGLALSNPDWSPYTTRVMSDAQVSFRKSQETSNIIADIS